MLLFRTELCHWLRQPIPYLFAFVLLAASFVTMWGMASEASGGDNAEILNSPFRLSFMTTYLSALLLFLLPSVVGAALHRDYKSRMFTLLYAYPITKRAYLLGKFGAAMVVVCAVVATIGIGFALGAMMPDVLPEVIAPFSWATYARLYGFFLLPNMVFFGLLVFLVVIKRRNIYLAFIAVIVVIAVQAVVSGLLQTADFQTLAALLDPTGDTAIKGVMRAYTMEERNTLPVPLSGVILGNRVLWSAVTVLLAIYTYRSFSFQQFAASTSSRKTPLLEVLPASGTPPSPPVRTGGNPLVRLWSLSTHNFRYITRTYAFLALLLVGLLTVFLQQAQMSPEYGFATLPTTGRMLRIPMFIFGMTINLITFLYVGVLAHRGRMTRMGELVDVCPVSDRILLGARLLAILRVQLLLLVLVMIGGIATQLSQGYTRVEVWHYVLELFGLQFVHFLIWACLATFIHTFFSNLYVGFFVLLLTGTAFGAVAELGLIMDWPILQDGVVQFNTTPRVTGGFAYSDWNVYGGVIGHYLAYKTYWLLCGGLLLLLTLAFWRRGYTFSWRERRMQAWDKIAGELRHPSLVLLSGFLTLGAALYYHDHVLADYQVSNREYRTTLAHNEKRFAAYLNVPQPRIARAEVRVDLFPAKRDYRAEGTLWYVNKLARPLDTIVVHGSFRDRSTYALGNPHTVIRQDSLVRTAVYRLSTPLREGDSLRLDFTARNPPNAPLWAGDRIKTNGTYLHGYHFVPKLGVRASWLTSPRERAEYGLPGQPPARRTTDLLGYGNTANGGDRIHYATTVSTSADQQAFSMGTLRKKWTENGRNYFRYTSDGPVANTLSWLSGRYEKTMDNGGSIPLQFHNHPDHVGELTPFREGAKSGLALNTTLFGPLAYDTLKMIEFPISNGSHATLNGNLIPTSEAYLLCDIDHEDNEVFNVPFFVGAHEIAHYWWAYQVDPANVPGSRVITEGLADYLAIETVAQTYGPDFAATLIEQWQRIYFRARAGRGNETPLTQTPIGNSSDYLNYRKAALVYHGLAGYLGKGRFHAALANFVRRYRHASPPFATIDDLVAELAAATPDSLRYLVSDYFETITLYDNAVTAATVQPSANGQFVLDLDFTVTKYHADARGKKSYENASGNSLIVSEQQSLPLADYVDLAVYAGEEEIYRQRVKVEEIGNRLQIELSRRPERVVIDPDRLLLDSVREDNESPL